MPSTANGYPYPAATDTPDVPRDIKALADKVDTLHGTVVGAIKWGSAVVTTDGVGIARIPGLTGYLIVSAISGDASAFKGIFVYDSVGNFLPLNLSGQGVINQVMRINYVAGRNVT